MYAAMRVSCHGKSAASLLRPWVSCGKAALCVPWRGTSGVSADTAPPQPVGDAPAVPVTEQARGLSEQMRERGFVNATPNFAMDFGSNAEEAAELAAELETTPVCDVDVARDLYGPWLVMTADLQGELFVDHDAFVFYRPANGIGYKVGRLQLIPAGDTGTAFRLELESYTYTQKASFAPRHAITLQVTGMVQRVASAKSAYRTLTLVGAWSKTDPNAAAQDDAEPQTGQFNCAKITPWSARTAADVQNAWRPSAELRGVFEQVFPDTLTLTSHVRRARGAEDGLPRHLQLEKYAVGSLPGVYYIPDYIDAEEERQILAAIKSTPPELKSKVTKRTVQEWGCSMCEECKQSFVSDANMPSWVQQCTDMLVHDGIFTPATFPNSVRIHEYARGEGIGPHCDGPIYVPLVTVLSMASTTVMNFYPRRPPYAEEPMKHYNDTFVFGEGEIGRQTPLQSVVMEPRSLLVFSGEAYYYHPHGVSDKEVDHLTPEESGEVVNRHLLHDRDVTEVQRTYRVSITTRNLLTRCNHQPSRAEYNMKRAWYLYHQLPIPDPLFTRPPEAAPDHGHTDAKLPATTQLPQHWDARLDALLAQQQAMQRSVDEMRQAVAAFVAGESANRKETSFVLNQLSTSVLDLDAKLDDLADALRAKTQPTTKDAPKES